MTTKNYEPTRKQSVVFVLNEIKWRLDKCLAGLIEYKFEKANLQEPQTVFGGAYALPKNSKPL